MAVVLPMWGQLPPLVELDKGKASYYPWAQKACHVINTKGMPSCWSKRICDSTIPFPDKHLMTVELIQTRKQQTIGESISVSGFGYWSGKDVEIEFRPAAEKSGLVFVRQAETGQHRIEALVHNREESPRRTNLMQDGHGVDMVEHVVAAMAGLQIDNCEIHCSSQEMPGLDGSSVVFTNALLKAGIVQQSSARMGLLVSRPVEVRSGDSWIKARPLADAARNPRTVLQYNLDYGPDSIIRAQSFRISLTPAAFTQQLASARTFVLKSEADQMLSAGIGQRVSTQDLIVFGDHGPIDTELRFEDECVRHKTLDMVGDLALSGIDLIGEFEAYRTGHRLNAELVRELLAVHQLPVGMAACA